MNDILIKRVDYDDVAQVAQLIDLLDLFSQETAQQGIAEHTRKNIAGYLGAIDGAFSLIAHCDACPIAFANCLPSFSTFACRPVVNIHDIFVLPEWRRRGVSQSILKEIEAIAGDLGCSKITLEVLVDNRPAQEAYHKCGFAHGGGTATYFMEKRLAL